MELNQAMRAFHFFCSLRVFGCFASLSRACFCFRTFAMTRKLSMPSATRSFVLDMLAKHVSVVAAVEYVVVHNQNPNRPQPCTATSPPGGGGFGLPRTSDEDCSNGSLPLRAQSSGLTITAKNRLRCGEIPTPRHAHMAMPQYQISASRTASKLRPNALA